MAKIKHTKNELKAQRIALARFERFLPMLQLKKQQLQIEIQEIDAQLSANHRAEMELRTGTAGWAGLWAGEDAGQLPPVSVKVRLQDGNIAGVPVPVLEGVETTWQTPDLFATPAWYDDAMEALAKFVRLRLERWVLEEKRRRIAQELAYTTQRVNLFEKVKIPECRENIRIIKIFLGDQQTAAVVRGKLAKRRTLAYESGGLGPAEHKGAGQR